MSSWRDTKETVKRSRLHTRAETQHLLEAALTGASDSQHSQQDENVTESLPRETTRQETVRQPELAATTGSHYEVENRIDPTPLPALQGST